MVGVCQRLRKKILKWDILKPFWEYAYHDKDYKKVIVFREYCNAGYNPKKHEPKEYHELKIQKESSALANWLKMCEYFDEKNSVDNNKKHS